ncbi:uncharacterized protein [Eleutherodactylus coqui]|uniref:uncharacterized protein n=1 Tax=Eleutherodactylus coqui TaxID=57060 RepID=UPI00346238BD
MRRLPQAPPGTASEKPGKAEADALTRLCCITPVSPSPTQRCEDEAAAPSPGTPSEKPGKAGPLTRLCRLTPVSPSPKHRCEDEAATPSPGTPFEMPGKAEVYTLACPCRLSPMALLPRSSARMRRPPQTPLGSASEKSGKAEEGALTRLRCFTPVSPSPTQRCEGEAAAPSPDTPTEKPGEAEAGALTRLHRLTLMAPLPRRGVRMRWLPGHPLQEAGQGGCGRPRLPLLSDPCGPSLMQWGEDEAAAPSLGTPSEKPGKAPCPCPHPSPPSYPREPLSHTAVRR